MVVDTIGEAFTSRMVNAIVRLGYVHLAQQLQQVAQEGSPTQKKRIPDSWVILHFNIGDSWREDRAINGFLKTVDEMVRHHTKDPNVWWWLRGAHDTLTHLVQSSDHTQTEAFFLRLLEALAPPEVWNL